MKTRRAFSDDASSFNGWWFYYSGPGDNWVGRLYWDSAVRHSGGLNIAFGDGHVTWAGRAWCVPRIFDSNGNASYDNSFWNGNP